MDERNDFVDFVKFILALLIVFLHTKPFSNELDAFFYPLLRIAVPVFFILSSYYFYKKCMNKSWNDQVQILKTFCIKNIRLYIGWFILLLPVTLIGRNYFKFGAIEGIKEIIIATFFGSTFYASWFLTALVLGVLIIFFMSKFANDGITLVFSFGAYCLCCLSSNYYFGINESIQNLLNLYPQNNSIYNGFLAGLLWIEIGRVMAIHKIVFNFKNIQLCLCIILTMMGLYAESYIIDSFNFSKANDCYFMLIPTSIFIVISILRSTLKIKYSYYLRDVSVVMYCLHLSLVKVFLHMPKKLFGFEHTVITRIYVYVIVVMVCIAATTCILKFERLKSFNLIKYLH